MNKNEDLKTLLDKYNIATNHEENKKFVNIERMLTRQGRKQSNEDIFPVIEYKRPDSRL